MATKEQNLKRLDELALILGREPDISGSAAEIAQRVAEWEEEMQSSGDDVQVMNMDMHPLDFSLLNRREADEEPEDDVLMQKAAGLAGGVRFGPDGNEVIPTSPDVADMTEDDVMLMTVSEGIAGGVRYG
ncbi:DNA-packaging protein FI [Escherichia coli]